MRRFVSIGVVLALLASTLEVRAQTSQPTVAELTEQATRDRDAGRLDRAIDGFSRAYQVSGDSHLLFSLAEVNRQAGRGAEAQRLFQTYLRRDPSGIDHESARQQMEELVRQGYGVRGAASGAKPATTPSTGAGGGAAGVPVGAAGAAAASPPPGASLGSSEARASEAPPSGARTSPSATSPPAPGAASRLEVEAPAAPPGPATPTAPPLPRWIPWTLGVFTVALGAAAVVSGVSASRRYDELSRSCGQTAIGCTDAQVDDVRLRAVRTTVLWALTTAALAGTGVAVYLNAHAAGASGLWRF